MRITGGNVLGDSGWLEATVEIADGQILTIDENSLVKASVCGSDDIDASGLMVLPGFIDLQVNGGWGLDFARSPESIWEVGRRLVETGVTSWLPTLITSPEELTGRALDTLQRRRNIKRRIECERDNA